MRPLWEVLGIRLGLVSDSANLSVSLTYNPRLSKKRKEKRLVRCALGLGKSLGRRRQGERESSRGVGRCASDPWFRRCGFVKMRVVTCDLTTWLLPACCLLLTAYCMICYQGERGSVAARFRWLLVVACCLAGVGVGSACRIWMRLRPGRW